MIKHSFIRFGMVGVAGLIVDSTVLTVLLPFLGPYWGRLVSFVCAVFTTWALNRSFTFAHRQSGLSLPIEFARYFVAMLGGGAVNYATYAALVALSALVARWPVIGVGVGSIVGMLVNFTLARTFIFARKADPVHEVD